MTTKWPEREKPTNQPQRHAKRHQSTTKTLKTSWQRQILTKRNSHWNTLQQQVDRDFDDAQMIGTVHEAAWYVDLYLYTVLSAMGMNNSVKYISEACFSLFKRTSEVWRLTTLISDFPFFFFLCVLMPSNVKRHHRIKFHARVKWTKSATNLQKCWTETYFYANNGDKCARIGLPFLNGFELSPPELNCTVNYHIIAFSAVIYVHTGAPVCSSCLVVAFLQLVWLQTLQDVSPPVNINLYPCPHILLFLSVIFYLLHLFSLSLFQLVLAFIDSLFFSPACDPLTCCCGRSILHHLSQQQWKREQWGSLWSRLSASLCGNPLRVPSCPQSHRLLTFGMMSHNDRAIWVKSTASPNPTLCWRQAAPSHTCVKVNVLENTSRLTLLGPACLLVMLLNSHKTARWTRTYK